MAIVSPSHHLLQHSRHHSSSKSFKRYLFLFIVILIFLTFQIFLSLGGVDVAFTIFMEDALLSNNINKHLYHHENIENSLAWIMTNHENYINNDDYDDDNYGYDDDNKNNNNNYQNNNNNSNGKNNNTMNLNKKTNNIKKSKSKHNNNSSNNNIENQTIRLQLVDQRRLFIEQQPIEFVHITKTAGTAIEYYGAKYANMTWGICHWKSSPLLYPACIADREIPSQFLKNYTTYNQLLSLQHFTNYHYLHHKPIVKGFEIWHAPPSWLQRNYSPYHREQQNEQGTYHKPMFAVIRNPYSRMISEFYCPFRGYDRVAFKDPSYRDPLTGQPIGTEEVRSKRFGNDYVYVRPIMTPDILNDWIQKKILGIPYNNTAHFIPQYEYIYDTSQVDHDMMMAESKRDLSLLQELPVIIQHVIKYENITNEFDELMKLYNITMPSFVSSQTVNGRQYQQEPSSENLTEFTTSDLSSKTIQLINQYYYYDFILLNYTMISE